MEHIRGSISIELEPIVEALRTIVRKEMAEMRDEIKQTLISKRESLLEEERLYTDQVRILLRKKSRHTVKNYINKGILPEPLRDLADRPYWTQDQLERAKKFAGIKPKYPT
jgi:hypothetical protein